MKMFKWVIFSVASLCGFCALIAQEDPQSSAPTDPPTVSPAEIELLNALTRTRDVIELSAEISGAIKSLNVMEGSRIEIGQELGKIKDERASLALEKAVLEWEVADKKQKSDIAVRLTDKAALVAATEYERAIRANKEIPNTYAESEVDRRKLVYEKAKLEIEQAAYERVLAAGEASVAKNGLDQAQLELRRHLITSPVNGMVIAIKRQMGEWVEPGMSILEVVDMDFFRVEGFVPLDKAALELAGREARVQISLGEDAWEKLGKVVFVSPEANPVNLQVRVIIEVPFSSEKERLSFRSGLKCKAFITLSRPETSEENSPAEPTDK
jgi:multidrug efflux pump subunit AcrA (membrane-fusion protein)